MKHITSTDNPLIKKVAKLKTKKERQLQQQFLAEGLRTCETIIQSGLKPLCIFATQEIIDTTPSWLCNYPITLVTRPVLKKISSATTPSGLLCVFPIRQQPPLDHIGEGIVLANIQDPGNMGTLIRTCVAFGKKTVIAVDGADPWNPKVIQSSAGTIAHTQLFTLSWSELLMHKKKLKLIALVVKQGKPPQKINFNQSLLVIGNEAQGIHPEYLSTCQEPMTIPMPGSTESLNAGTAGAIAMYLAWKPL